LEKAILGKYFYGRLEYAVVLVVVFALLIYDAPLYGIIMNEYSFILWVDYTHVKDFLQDSLSLSP